MPHTFDLVVIGTGPAAATAVPLARKEGWSVAVVDERPFGGTCPNRGCIPKKVLWGAADVMDALRRASVLGVQAPSASLDWAALQAFKRTFTGPVPLHAEQAFLDAGAETFHGTARFVSAREVRVGADTTLTAARHVLIATGARPLPLGIAGEEHVVTSDDFLDLRTLPRRIAFIGGGYVSMEFAHIALRAGAEVTVLHRGGRPLPGFDPDLVDALVKESRTLGMRIELGVSVQGVERTANGFRVHGARGASYDADLVVHGAGRAPNLDALDLPAAGVEREPRGVRVNAYMQSVSNPLVYAAGDAAASGPPLTPVGSRDAEIATANMLRGNHHEVDHTVVPSVAFTLPPIASVGLTEEAARTAGRTFRVNAGDSASWLTSRRVGETASGYKVLLEEETGRILGAHLLGAHAEEVINLFALAMRHDLRAGDLATLPWAYPSRSYDITYML